MEELESRLARKPPITVPAITIDGTQDPLKPGGTADHGKMFKAKHEHRVVECGHNLPWEAPEEFADAVLALRSWQRISGDVLARLANSGSSGASSRLQWKFLSFTLRVSICKSLTKMSRACGTGFGRSRESGLPGDPCANSSPLPVGRLKSMSRSDSPDRSPLR